MLTAESPRSRQLTYTIILNWNGWRDTAECVRSLLNMRGEAYELLIVDNGSTDDSVTRLRQELPAVEILETGANLGFAGGNNVGIRLAIARGAEFVWLVNNDTKVDPGALNAMVELARTHPKVGAIGSVLYEMETPERVQHWGGGTVNLWLGRSWSFTESVANGRLKYLSGASMLLRRQALEDVGLLDDGFFMYWEDSDICFRLRQAGWKIAVAEKSKVWHKQCASTGKKSIQVDLLMKASMIRFLKKHSRLPYIGIFNGLALMIANRVVQRDWTRTSALIADIFNGSNSRIAVGGDSNARRIDS